MSRIIMNKKFYQHESFGDIVQQGVMPIFAIADGEIIPLGTGFVIMSNGLMITAKHVIEDFLKPDFKKRDSSGNYKDKSLYALHITNTKHGDNDKFFNGGPWRILRIHYSLETDIAFCWLEGMYKDGEYYLLPTVKLSPGIPPVSSKILGFGYHNSSAVFTNDFIDGKMVANYSHETVFTEGSVVEIIKSEGNRTFPHFRSDARFEPGMSGGPVFNESGGVCGVICSSFSGCTDESGYISYVSLIWPALGTYIETTFKDGAELESVTILDLIHKDFISVDETIKNIEIVNTEEGSTVKYQK